MSIVVLKRKSGALYGNISGSGNFSINGGHRVSRCCSNNSNAINKSVLNASSIINNRNANCKYNCGSVVKNRTPISSSSFVREKKDRAISCNNNCDNKSSKS